MFHVHYCVIIYCDFKIDPNAHQYFGDDVTARVTTFPCYGKIEKDRNSFLTSIVLANHLLQWLQKI